MPKLSHSHPETLVPAPLAAPTQQKARRNDTTSGTSVAIYNMTITTTSADTATTKTTNRTISATTAATNTKRGNTIADRGARPRTHHDVDAQTSTLGSILTLTGFGVHFLTEWIIHPIAIPTVSVALG